MCSRQNRNEVRSSLGNVRRGYTLLEVMLSMAIVVVFLASVVPLSKGLLVEARLRRPADELEMMARQARNLAVSSELEHRIVFENNTLRLVTKEGLEKIRFDLSDSISFAWKAWDHNNWTDPGLLKWRFQSNGWSEPISVKFQLNENILVQSYSPVTAGVREEEYSIL